MNCANASPAPLRCPTLQESIDATLKLLPRGRAWQSNEGGPQPFHDAPFDPSAFDPATFDATTIPGTILYRFWAAVGAVRNYLEARLCALRLEFWCATQTETNDQWMREYGLPDSCDPFPDLCTKVAALGGARCDYFASVAARSGWTIACSDLIYRCAGVPAGRALAGRARAGAAPRSLCKLEIIVYLGLSKAYSGPLHRRPLAGRLLAGQRLACLPDLTPLQCVLERIVPAHMTIDYQTAA
jgi:hypothetical protein